MSNYYVVKEPDAGDIFGSIMAFLVVLFIIFAFAAMIGFYILLIFLGIGVLIGMGYAIYAYIKGFINACKTISGVHGRNGLTSLLLRWFVLFKNASVFVIKDTFAIAKNSPKIEVGVSLLGNLLELKLTYDEMSMDQLIEILSAYKKKKKFYRLKNGCGL